MTSGCPTCGSPLGAAARYCLHCGTLVGRRPVALDLFVGEPGHTRDSGPRTPVSAVAPPTDSPLPTATAAYPSSAPSPAAPVAALATPAVGLWRRPATSLLAAAALATGLTAGYLLDPQDGTAGGTAVARTQPAATAPAAEPPATTTTAPAPAAVAAAPDPAADAAATTAAAPPATAAPSATDTTAAATVAAPTASDDAATTAPSAGTTTTPAAERPAKKAARPATSTDEAKRPATTTAASDLPKIDHIWLVGIGSPVAPREGGYLGEALLASATELPKYAPVATEPLAGAADLLAGRAPSATAKTITDQLAAAKRSWRVYTPGATECSAAPDLNPLLAFPSVASAAGCADGIAPLSALPADVASKDAPPAFTYVALDPTLDPAALDEQLKRVVEPIRRSAAFKRAGLLAIVPTAANPVASTGALLLSPFVAGSTSVGTALGPYALLRTFQDLLGLKPLGGAGATGVRPLGPDVITPDD